MLNFGRVVTNFATLRLAISFLECLLNLQHHEPQDLTTFYYGTSALSQETSLEKS